jgi:hypothetical protein
VFSQQEFRKCIFRALISAVLMVAPVASTHAGGGSVLASDTCIVKIDFYSVHLTVYQPDSSGSQQFCLELPDTGDSMFVLDYLHPSLKEVPVGLRIIRDVTGLGRFVKLKNVEAIKDIDKQTVFYQPPVIEVDGSLKNEVTFRQEGEFIGIISAGYPGNDKIYTAVFPIKVGGSNYFLMLSSVLVLAGAMFFLTGRLIRTRQMATDPGSAS